MGDHTWALLLAGPEVKTPTQVIDEQRRWLLDQVPASASVSQRAVLEAAVATLGWREEPDGSNSGPEVGRISGGYYPPGQGNPPWCALAVSYWLREGLQKSSWTDIPFGDRFGGVAQITAWAKKSGRLQAARASVPAAPGMIFVMGRKGSGSDLATVTGAGHTGLVVRDEGADVLTIEGNTSNKVASRRRAKSTLGGLATWW